MQYKNFFQDATNKENTSRQIAGWLDDPLDIPDILTHFSSNGIYMFQIEQEFVWLERIYYSIREKGYQDDLGGKSIETLKLVSENSQKKYIVTDGNHRISAIYALEKNDSIRCKIIGEVYEEDLCEWELVKEGYYDKDDARKIFSVYFSGNEMNSMQFSDTERGIVIGMEKVHSTSSEK